MSVVIYDSSSEDLSSDEYSHDEDDDDLMNAAVTAGSASGSNKIVATKTNISTLVTPTKAARVRVAPPHGREQTAKQIFLLKKKRCLHTFYKRRSIKCLNDRNKRDEQRKSLKQRMKLSSNAAEMLKLESLETQKVAKAGKELEQFLIHQRAAAADSLTTLKEQRQNLSFVMQEQPIHEIMVQVQKELAEKHKQVQSLQCTPAKPVEVVCLDDTENEESPEKSNLPENEKSVPFASELPQPAVPVQTINTHMTIVDVRGADFDVDNDVAVVQTEVNATEIEICTPKVEPEKPEITIPKEIHLENNMCNEPLLELPVPPVETAIIIDIPLRQNIEEQPEPMDLEIIPNNVPLKPPIMAPINVNHFESKELPKNPIQLHAHARATVAAAAQNATNDVIFAPPPPPPSAQVGSAVSTPMRIPLAWSTSTPRPSVAIVHNTPIQNVRAHPPAPVTQAANFSMKRPRSLTPDAPQAQPNGDKSPVITNDTQQKQPAAKRQLLDPASNAVFYDKIKDLLPAYEEAISAQVKAAITTDDKLNEKIKRINSDLNTLGEVLKTKEEEWNRLLYLKRVKEELLERLLRMKQVHKATKRCQNVKDYSIKQLQELEACLSGDRPTPVAEKPSSNIETLGTQIKQLLNNRANMRTADLLQEEEMLKSLKHYLLQKDTDGNDLCRNRVDSTADHRTKCDEHSSESRQRPESHVNKSASLAEREQHQQHRVSQSYVPRSQSQFERPIRNAARPPFNVDYSKHNSATEPQYSVSQPPVSMGRQGAFKDVQSIIDDFRREHPDTLPRVGKRLKPEMYATQQNDSYSYPQHANLSVKDIPTLQKLLSGRPRNNLQQHSYVAPMPKPPLYRPGYNAGHDLSGTSTRYTEEPPRNYIPKRNMRPNLNDFEYYGRNDIEMNGAGSGAGVPNKYKLRICQECYKCEAGFVCGGCTNQWYCSKECQLTGWEKHQHFCGF